MSPFIKFEEDIIRAYQAVNGNFENISDSLFYELNKKLTPFLNDLLNSYYFEDDFKANSNLDDTNYTINYHENENCTPFLDLDYLKYDDKPKIDYNIEIDEDSLINALKQIDPLYELIYEDSPIKQKLNLINKKELEFKTIYVTHENIREVFAELHNIGIYEKNWNKHQTYQVTRTLQEDLSQLNKLDFINLEYNVNRTFIIAHNKHQIAGVSCIANYSMLDTIDEKKYFARKNMAYSSYVAVSSQFRGNGLAVELMKKTFEYAKENNKIIIRSKSTFDGKSFLEENVDKLMLKTKDTAIVNSRDENLLNNFSKLIRSIKSDKEYELFYNKIKPVMLNIATLSIENEKKCDLLDNNYEERAKVNEQYSIVIKDIIKNFHDEFEEERLSLRPSKLKIK